MIFHKTVAAGNDFLHINLEGKEPDFDPAQVAKNLCNRHEGAGADGLVFYSEIEEGIYSFRIFNKDGGEAELSGNGMGGCASVIFNSTNLKKVTFNTKVGYRTVELKGSKNASFLLLVEIGKPDFENREHFPFIEEDSWSSRIGGFTIYPVSVGNPHVVVLYEKDEDRTYLLESGKLLERHNSFPEGTNVEFLLPDSKLSKGYARVFFYERGAGFTTSSSTGSSAVYAVLKRLRLLKDDDSLSISTEKGPITVSGKDTIYIENRIKVVYKGTYLL